MALMFRDHSVRKSMLDPPSQDAAEKYPECLPPTRPRALTIPIPEPSPIDIAEQEYQQKQLLEAEQAGFFYSLFWGPGGAAVPPRKIIQRTHDQLQSPLCRLPYEIRVIIWNDLLAGFRWHLGRGYRKLLGTECNGDHTTTDITNCEHRLSLTGLSIESTLKPVGRLSVLQSCRLIYSETVQLLYKTNIFDIPSMDLLISLSQNILPTRLSLIRTLKLTHTFHDPMSRSETYQGSFRNFKQWEKTCSLLGNMVGLEKVYFVIQSMQLNQGDQVDAIFYPLELIKAKTLEIWVSDQARWEEKDVPASLLKREGFAICVQERWIGRAGIAHCCVDRIEN